MDETRSEIVPILLPDGTRLGIEARAVGGREKAGLLEAQPLADITRAIEAVAMAFGDSLKRIGPRKAAIEFGIEVAVESGKLTALICKGSGKANLKITLQWEVSTD